MHAHRRPRCGFCLKTLSSASRIHLHITNTPKCRAAQVRERNRRSESPLADTSSNTNLLDLDHMNDVMADDMDGFAEHDETDYISSEHTVVDNNASQMQEVKDEDVPRRYAEDYNPADVAHILRKTQTAFETLEEIQNNAGFSENPWAPFEDEAEWELARFLMKEVSQTAADKYLKLPIVSKGLLTLMVLTNC
jgi:hypothetical protein